ncbi:MAG: hypothetical protein K2X86_10065 [Cytophagaceae bacterium]|nr:hypothetical protein [Cytophagaceae bacterium]
MNSFLNLNRHKIGFAFFICLLIVLIFIAIIGIFSNSNQESLNIITTVIMISLAALLFPSLIIITAYWEWLRNTRKRKKAYNTVPFDKLERLGFSKSLKNQKTKWYFTEEIKQGTINDFHLICDIDLQDPKIMEFKALVKFRAMGDNFHHIKSTLNLYDIDFDDEYITKRYNLKNLKIATDSHLKADLEKFIDLLKKENFEPEYNVVPKRVSTPAKI